METLSLSSRLALAWRLLADGALAARALRSLEVQALPAARDSDDSLDQSDDASLDEDTGDSAEELAERSEAAAPPVRSEALALLSLLQREGRLVDFLQQDIASFDDAEIGAAARVVHAGCRKALAGHLVIAPVRDEAEESSIRVSDGIATGAVKLTGNVRGEPPYAGVLRHKGWRVTELSLPELTDGHDPNVVAPAEVEMG